MCSDVSIFAGLARSITTGDITAPPFLAWPLTDHGKHHLTCGDRRVDIPHKTDNGAIGKAYAPVRTVARACHYRRRGALPNNDHSPALHSTRGS